MFQFVFLRFPVVHSYFLHAFISITFVVIIYLMITIWLFSFSLCFFCWYILTLTTVIFAAHLFEFLKFRNTILQVFRVRFVFRNIFYKTNGYLLDRTRCCARTLISWLSYVLLAFIYTNITATCFQRFFMMRIHSLFLFGCTGSLFFSLIIIRTQSIFMLVCFIVSHTHSIEDLLFLLVNQSYYRMKFFVDLFFPNNFRFNSLGA